MTAFAIVHASPTPCGAAEDKPAPAAAGPASKGPEQKNGKPTPARFTGKLPANVEEMREQILAAVNAGNIDELAVAIAWNELKPDFGAAGSDPIPYWKSQSADGAGREILAVLANLLAMEPAELRIGRDVENAAVYVWPYLAEVPPAELTPAQEVDLYRLMPPDKAKALKAGKSWTWWRLAIGADGTWHVFKKFD